MPDPEEALLQEERNELLKRAMAELPTEYREVLVLRELEQLSYREIADIADTPIGTVMSRLSRARQRLHHTLSRRGFTVEADPAPHACPAEGPLGTACAEQCGAAARKCFWIWLLVRMILLHLIRNDWPAISTARPVACGNCWQTWQAMAAQTDRLPSTAGSATL
jgi:hypothetical protein